jgi:hypothetical protein
MASTYTTNLGIEKIATGEQSGTWGATTNTNLDLIDQAVNGVVQITVAATGSTGSPNALTITNGSASDGRNKFIDFYSPTDLGGTVYYQLDPNDAEKIAFVRNSLGGGQTLVLFQGTYNASNDVEVPNGVDMLVKFDGTGASATVTNVFEKLQVNALSVNDGNITNVGDIALDSISADGTDINLSVSDNSATALTVKEGANTYLTIDTTDSAEKVLVSKTLDVGDNNITNVGNIALDSISADGTQIDIDITDNTASAFTISEGANNYIAITTTDGSELITVSKNSTFAGTTVADLGVVTTADINGGTIDGVTIGGASAGAITGTTITGTSFVTSGNMTFGDSDKAIFGAGSDLQIYHDGLHSYISDQGTGRLKIFATDLEINNAGNTANYIQAFDGGAVQLFHNNAEKLATTATGIDVTGTVTADGLTVAQSSGANILLESTTTGATTGDIFGEIEFKTNDASSPGIKAKIDAYSEGGVGNTALRLFTGDTTGLYQRLNIASNGDISFYEPTGTTPKLFWDASEETVSIGASTSTGDPLFIIHNEATVLSTHIAANGSLQGKGSLVNVRNDSSTNGAFAGLEFNTTRLGGTEQRAFIVANAEATGFAPSIVFGQRTASGAMTERLRIDSSGNVGIGTTSPASKLHILGTTVSSAAARFNLISQDDTAYAQGVGGGILFRGIYNSSGTVSDFASIQGAKENTINGNHAGALIFTTRPQGGSPTERMRIDSSGNLGLGVTPNAWSANYKAIQSGNGSAFAGFNGNDQTFVVSNAYNDGAWKYKNSAGAGRYTIQGIGGGVHAWFTAPSGTAGDPITFTQAMTLDASGNLLVGKTTTAFGTQGIRLEGSNGKIEITRNNNLPFAINRLTSDGDLIQFYKDGTAVGSIGVISSDLAIYSTTAGHHGLRFAAGQILPTNNAGTIVDNQANLGDTSFRFKDLYLSGNVYLGGTTSANALDDYEEGVWTPVLNRTTLGTVTYTLQTGYYVKIGRVVYVWGKVTWSNISSVGSGNNYISGLPFSAGTGQANGWANFGGSSGVATNPVLAGLFYNQTVYLRKSANILADGNIGEDYNNSGTFGFNGMYNIL